MNCMKNMKNIKNVLITILLVLLTFTWNIYSVKAYEEENIDNERVFDDYTSKALVALNISINDLIEFVPKHKSTDTVCRESVPKDYRMSKKPESSTVCSWTFSNFARFIIEKLTGGRHEVLHSRLPLLS